MSTAVRCVYALNAHTVPTCRRLPLLLGSALRATVIAALAICQVINSS